MLRETMRMVERESFCARDVVLEKAAGREQTMQFTRAWLRRLATRKLRCFFGSSPSQHLSASFSHKHRLKTFAEIEAILQERATLDTDPLTLPDDFKQLCALTNQIRGPALPKTNSQIADAFDGLHASLMGLVYPSSPRDELESEVGLGFLDWEVTVVLEMGGVEDAIGGGCWLCWCKNDCED
jgi:hypothetical protein